jgi:cytochrome c oxidase assembly protein Cox11/mono/diheme cytochrome c family protein
LVGIGVALGVMFTLVSYSVTLYRMFCEATGSGGFTQRVAANDDATLGREITVAFTTNVAPNLPWRFVPVQREVKLRLGQETVVFFRAENLSDHDLVGHATFNVTPQRAGIYFKKIECFCFTEERLEAHKSVEMPVDFFVDSRMGQDREDDDIHTITLSYTFFNSKNPDGATDMARFGDRPPDAHAGQELFATVCAACHGLDRAKEGPPLRRVFDRKAGSAPGYPYSKALQHADLNWTADNLDRWLASPQGTVPGAQMSYHLDDKLRRGDVIAYLRSLAKQPHAEAAQPNGPSKL